MCGLVGFIETERQSKECKLESIVTDMARTLKHRGPDDSGAWVDEKVAIALGHRRLSIIDLSREGRQPMHSSCGRYVITYNGEVYNFKELKHELERSTNSAQKFRGHSDTEIILAAIAHWGLEKAINRFIGMFAFALWDKKNRNLYLAQDRLGIKPLYYGFINKTFMFGSQLKALKVHPDFQAEIDRNALALMLRHCYIPAPHSIYKSIYKLSPGTFIVVSSKELREKVYSVASDFEPKTYWDVKEIAEKGVKNYFNGTEKETIKQLDNVLREAVKLRMISDVPLGAFLSGGIDSSIIVSMMQAQSNIPVKTFSIGYAEEDYNEAIHAKAIAQYLGTDHTELYVAPKQALDIIPLLPDYYDEPFSDASQIPTFLVSQLAKEHVKVSLSGDGGDELFGGYNRYFWGKSIWQKTGWMPHHLQKIIARMLTSVSPQMWDDLFLFFASILPKHIKQRTPGDKIHKLSEILGGKTAEEMYFRLSSYWKEPEKIVKGSFEPPTIFTQRENWPQLDHFAHMMMFLDMVSYLPHDILTKVDRASMAVSLEARVPMLDHRVVEFAWKIPFSMKIRNGEGKWILKQLLKQYVPEKLTDRPKMGFAVPIDAWLRGPLREWAESLLDEKRLREEGYFHHEPIRKKWVEHLSGKRNWQYYLWSVLMFQAWLEKNR